MAVPVQYLRAPDLAARSPKIIFVNRFYDPDQSATSQMLTDLARGLSAEGFDVRVVASRQLYEDSGAHLEAKETLCGVQVHRVATTRFGRGGLPGRAMDYLSFYLACTVLLMKLLRRRDILVVKTDPPLMSIMGGARRGAQRGGISQLAAGRLSRSGVSPGREPFASLGRPLLAESGAMHRSAARP